MRNGLQDSCAYPSFCSMKWLEVEFPPLDVMLVHCKVTPQHLPGFPDSLPIPIYIPEWREALSELSVMLKRHNAIRWSGFKPRLPNLKSSG